MHKSLSLESWLLDVVLVILLGPTLVGSLIFVYIARFCLS